MKNCFIVCPIGEKGSEIRKRSDQVLKYLIRPALKQFNYKSIRADEISDPGIITNQIILHLLNDDLVIADLSGHNPNVFYELGIRHAISKPFIHIIGEGERIPFDLSALSTIFFDHRDLDSVEDAKLKLIEYIQSVENNTHNVVTPLTLTKALEGKQLRYEVESSVYIPENDENKAYQLTRALDEMADVLGFKKEDESPPERSSWFKKTLFKTSDEISENKILEIFKRAEFALVEIENEDSEKTQFSESAKKLIESLKNVESAIIRFGELIIIKDTFDGEDFFYVDILNSKEKNLVDKHPELLKNPREFLEALKELRSESNFIR